MVPSISSLALGSEDPAQTQALRGNKGASCGLTSAPPAVKQ